MKRSHFSLFSLILAFTIEITCFGQGNLVANGGFESGFDNWDWTVNFGVGSFPWAAEGNNFGEPYGTIAQNLFTTPGQLYHLSFELAGNFNISATSEIVVHWGDSSLAPVVWSPLGHSISNPGWIRADFDVVAATSSTKLTFENPNGFVDGRIPRLDAISVLPVPEPPLLGLLVTAGTVAFAGTRTFRRLSRRRL